ncbi:hypothetical protein RRG08_029271 [Elysia crispata]|uniref:Uncharacterized protein n=1 Tax=Elysia crispata TaxID=231223 RepID=A0AAE1AJ05_9GAST|nr:hypothetical protein RRG08_029271 [Elysia crispata]
MIHSPLEYKGLRMMSIRPLFFIVLIISWPRLKDLSTVGGTHPPRELTTAAAVATGPGAGRLWESVSDRSLKESATGQHFRLELAGDTRR